MDLQNPLIQDNVERNPLLKRKPIQGYGKKCPIC